MKRKFNYFVFVFMVLMILVGCTKNNNDDNNNKIDISGKTFYTTQGSVWLAKDNTFVITDGTEEIVGKWSINENVLNLESEKDGKIIFEVEDDKTIVLKTSLKNLVSGTTFTTDKSEEKPETATIKGTFANTSQSGNTFSYVELREDMSFTFIDRNDFSITETNGTYSVDKDTLTLSDYTGTISIGAEKIELLIKDNKTLILQTDVGVSAVGDIFVKDAPIQNTVKNIPCTGLKSLYNNYWSVEGSSSWNIEVTPTPADTTDIIYYSSDDENVVKIDEKGNMYPQKPGKTKIHIKCGDQELVVGFETKSKGPQSVLFDTDNITLLLGNTGTIKATVTPDTADQTLTYSSEDKSVITIDNSGNYKTTGPGVTNIKATASNGVEGKIKVIVEGETVIFEMENKVSVKAGSGQKIPYKATHIACYDGNISKTDVTKDVDFHTAYTSALDIDGSGNVYAKGAVFETVDIDVYFTYTDGSSFFVTSPTFIVHVEK